MSTKHLKCWLWKLLWVLGALSLVLAWVAGVNGQVLQLPGIVWFFNALVFGILAVPIKLDCHSCDTCGVHAK